jgi:DNA repair exonuclease SbcCD nuclease subunit
MPVDSLFIGDPHIQVGNIQDVNLLIERLINLAKEKKPTFIVIGGDVLHDHERLHTLALNKAYELIDNMRIIAPTYILVGNHDYCLGKDVPVLLWNGNKKLSQDIKIGDVLIGDDGLQRNVINTCSGISNMYKIKQTNGDDYIVSENHILSLKNGYHKSICWNNAKCAWTVKWIDRQNMKLKSKFFANQYIDKNDYVNYNLRTTQESKKEAEIFLNSIDDIDIIDISVKDYLNVQKNIRERLYGFTSDLIKWPHQDIIMDPYIYGMWIGDGSKDGKSFSSADLILIKEWWEWVNKKGGIISHSGQYNFQIITDPRTSKDICDPKHNTKNCKACINHIKKYNRAPSLACASIEEITKLIEKDKNMITYFSKGASKEQLYTLNDDEELQLLFNWKKKVINTTEIYTKQSVLTSILKDNNLYNNKCIPKSFIVNDENVRLQLLAGMIDTDGTVTSDKRNVIISQDGTNIHLVNDINLIAKSLGFHTTLKDTTIIQDGTKRYIRTLNITGDLEKIPTKITRKKCKAIMNNGIDIRGRKCSDKSKTSINVTPIGKGEYYGFEVDMNNRFILGDCTCVHNCNNQQYLTTNHWMNALKEWDNIYIIDKVLFKNIDNKNFTFVPYVPVGRFEECLNDSGVEWGNSSCIFAHQEFAGCKMGAIISIEGDNWDNNFPDVISGHIHSKQRPQDNVYYPGSSLQIAFGESDKKIVAYLTFLDDLKYNVDEINLNLPRKKIIYLDVKEIDNYKPINTEDKIKITLSGDHDEFKAFKKSKKYKDLISNNIKVVFKPKKIELLNKKDVNFDSTDFKYILNSIVLSNKDPYLFQAYERIINDNETLTEDVFFI